MEEERLVDTITVLTNRKMALYDLATKTLSKEQMHYEPERLREIIQKLDMSELLTPTEKSSKKIFSKMGIQELVKHNSALLPNIHKKLFTTSQL